MSDAIASILSQIRSYESQASGAAAARAPAAANPTGFSETLQRAIGSVNSAQKEAGALTRAFELGDPNADLARVMVATQQSQVAFRATVEVRNRLVQAYQDVMNMPI